MSPAVEGDIWAKHGSGPNGHEARIDYRAVEVDEDVHANFDIGSIIDVDGPLNPGVTLQYLVVFLSRCARGRERGVVIRYPAQSLLNKALEGRKGKRKKKTLAAHSFQCCAISRLLKSPALLNRPTASPQRRLAATRLGVKA